MVNDWRFVLLDIVFDVFFHIENCRSRIRINDERLSRNILSDGERMLVSN